MREFSNFFDLLMTDAWSEKIDVDSPSLVDSTEGIITDAQLLNLEERCPRSNVEVNREIWVASPDLSNVADAKRVREVVKKNAQGGFDYHYVYPVGVPGAARVKKLQECFPRGVRGKLFRHEVEEARFREITLVCSHFISFNPQDQEAVVYMQLPLSAEEKGWIKLDLDDSNRIVSAMRTLITDHVVQPG